MCRLFPWRMSVPAILRMALLVAVLLCPVLIACAQATEEQEKQADAMLQLGDAEMKVANYEVAIKKFGDILKRYPGTQTRYKAQFRIADAYIALKQDPKAVELLQSVVKEDSQEWSPQALALLGDIAFNAQKYAEGFRAYQQIFVEYPNSPLVDKAHFAIGVTHFRLGHYELAAQELDKVGTGYAARQPDLQRVSPGEQLYIALQEPNAYATLEMKLPVTVTTTSGDKETVALIPEAEGDDHFGKAIMTALGTPKPGDGILQMRGNDTVTLAYKTHYIGGQAQDKTITLTTASNARIVFLDSQVNEVRGIVLGDTMSVQIDDADRDLNDTPDTLTVQLKTKKGDSETLTLTETGAHTGLFRGAVKTVKGAPAADSKAIETNADFAEGSITQLDDSITVTYTDEISLAVKDKGSRTLTGKIALYSSTNAMLTPVKADIPGAELEIQTLIYKGRSLTQIATMYRDLGQAAKAELSFREASTQFTQIERKYPKSPAVEDALFGLFENYVAQELYNYAVMTVARIQKMFPQSPRAPEAMMGLAAVHVKRGDYPTALALYQQLSQANKDNIIGDEARFAICTTYLTMLKPKVTTLNQAPPVNVEQVAFALEQFARQYPDSDHAAEALSTLVRLRYDGGDYRGAIDSAQRMYASYPDNVLTGRAMLLMAQAQLQVRDKAGAGKTLQLIIANYGPEADTARSMLRRTQPSGGSN